MRRTKLAWLYLAGIIGCFSIAASLPKNEPTSPVCQHQCTVYVDRVIDGDTFSTNGKRVRIESLRADEAGTPRGDQQTACLKRLIEGRNVTIIPHGLDVYGRTLAMVVSHRITC